MSVWFKLPVNEAVPMERRLGTADAVVIGLGVVGQVLAQTLLAGGKPPVEIQGDVQLAAESSPVRGLMKAVERVLPAVEGGAEATPGSVGAAGTKVPTQRAERADGRRLAGQPQFGPAEYSR